MSRRADSAKVPVGVVVGTCPVRLWGISGEERARRTLVKAGVRNVAPDADTAAADASFLMVRADWVVDSALVGMLKAEPPGVVLTTEKDGETIVLAAHVGNPDAAALHDLLATPAGAGVTPPPGLHVIAHDAAAPSIYLPYLRKRLTPVVMPLTEATIDAAERATFKGSYKGVTDIVTKYAWPMPARWVARWCAEHGVTPNMVTLTGLFLVFLATALFAQGWFVSGLAAAWLMTFLDTVDGKLARCTLTYTPFGNVFDHGIDLISPPFWWWMWHVGCLKTGAAYPMPELALALVVGGYVILRIEEGLFRYIFDMQIHVWRRFDSIFRLIVARRNPLLILFSIAVVLDAPGWGMAAAALWTAISILVHAVQIAQALLSRRSKAIVSWMAG